MRDEALYRGCDDRLRPVLMTAALTNIGLVPMMLATGIGSEVQRPLAVVVVWGVVTATVLTLLVVPALFKLFERIGRSETALQDTPTAVTAGGGVAAPAGAHAPHREP